jgi:hypothetical protein
MESQMFNQWIQAQILEAPQQNAVGVVLQHETARSDDWSMERSQSMANLTVMGLADLNEFTTLTDLPGECTNVVHESCRGFRHDPYCSIRYRSNTPATALFRSLKHFQLASYVFQPIP